MQGDTENRCMDSARLQEQGFARAQVFRRMSPTSFAVHLENSPGVVCIHCTDVDWGAALETWRGADELEDRLLDLGMRRSFELHRIDSQHEEMVLQPMFARGVPISFDEGGIFVRLGPYSPKLRAFVQCSIRCTKPLDTAHAIAVPASCCSGAPRDGDAAHDASHMPAGSSRLLWMKRMTIPPCMPWDPRP